MYIFKNIYVSYVLTEGGAEPEFVREIWGLSAGG
jgi:hypothetical protein